MKIYTRGGDGGETSLIGGARVPKWHPRMEACGALDELNALLGALRLHVQGGAEDAALEAAQWDLFALGAAMADPDAARPRPGLKFTMADMEEAIDRLMPEGGPGGFVLPGGSPKSVAAHHARTVCRRAERAAAQICASGGAPAWICAHLNRLGDWLFATAVG